MFSGMRLLAIARKEVIQIRRDARSLALAFLLPVLLLVLFGYAITWDVRDIPLAVVDLDRSAPSRALRDAFRSSGYFTLKAEPGRTEEIVSMLDRGSIRMALVIPPDFAEALGTGRPAPVQAIVDGSDANTAGIALAYAQAVALTYSSRVAHSGSGAQLPALSETRVWYNDRLSSRNMIVPGLVAVIMMVIAAMLTSLTIAREWERGTMEQLAATPVTRGELIIGKLLPYLAIGLIDVAMTSVLGIAVFGVPFRGNVLLLGILSLFFLTGSLGFGMVISAATRSQVLATQLAMITTFLPAFLLSGFMFAIDNMPRALQALSYAVPARYFLVVTRGIFLKGVGVPVLYGQGLLMMVFAAAGLLLAGRAFRKEIG